MLMVTSFLALVLATDHPHRPQYKPLLRPEVVGHDITDEAMLLANDRAHKGCIDSLEAQRESALHQAARLATSRRWDSVLLSFNLGANYITQSYVIIGAREKERSIFMGPGLEEIPLSETDYEKMLDILRGPPSQEVKEAPQDEACRVLIQVTRQGSEVFGSKTDVPGKDSSVILQFDAWLEPFLPE